MRNDMFNREIERIAGEHPEAKGVVHFHSYEWFRAIYRNVSPGMKDRVMVHGSDTRNERLDEFKSSPLACGPLRSEDGEGDGLQGRAGEIYLFKMEDTFSLAKKES